MLHFRPMAVSIWCKAFVKMSQESIILERRVVPEGALILRQGDEGNCAYLVQSGAVSVYTTSGDKKIELAVLGPGEIFGEISLIFDEKRTASVKAIEETTLVVMNRDVFKSKLKEVDPIICSVISALTKRLVSGNTLIASIKEPVDSADE